MKIKYKRLAYIFGIICLIWFVHRSELNLGICLNEYQDGHLYNGEPYYNYISYKWTTATTDDIVLTYDLLNPFNHSDDDIVFRQDWVIGRWYGFAR